jgi:predicted DNA-binding transcriptional regulator AlpA
MKPVQQPVIEQLPPRAQTLDRFLTRREVLHHIGLSNTTLYKLLKEGNFPKQIRLKHCTNVMWSAYAVYQWMEDQKKGINK